MRKNGRSYHIVLCVLLFLSTTANSSGWVRIPGGTVVMGDELGDANEIRQVRSINPFEMMRYEVTNQDFDEFVTLTGYITDVEREGLAYVWTQRWDHDPNANYRRPHGRTTSIVGMDTHPVVQVSARDAEAYCMFQGGRLPTEAEWEYAARGEDERRFPWGNEPPTQHSERPIANFGTDRCCAPSDRDGAIRTASVGSYPLGASPFGVQDLAGNVWEWTSTPFPGVVAERVIRGGGWGNNPYCLRVSYRHGNLPNVGLNMVGFRCARSLVD